MDHGTELKPWKCGYHIEPQVKVFNKMKHNQKTVHLRGCRKEYNVQKEK